MDDLVVDRGPERRLSLASHVSELVEQLGRRSELVELFGSVLVVNEEPCVQEAAASQSQLRFRRLDLRRALVQGRRVAAEGCSVVEGAKPVAKLISDPRHSATFASAPSRGSARYRAGPDAALSCQFDDAPGTPSSFRRRAIA